MKLTTVGMFLTFWLESGIYDSYYLYFIVSGLQLTLIFYAVSLKELRFRSNVHRKREINYMLVKKYIGKKLQKLVQALIP